MSANYQDIVKDYFDSEGKVYLNQCISKYSLLHSKCYFINDSDSLKRINERNPYQLVIDTLLLNTYKDINEVLNKINSSLKESGYFIGRYETLELRDRRLKKDNGKFTYYARRFYDFLFKRVLPRLPIARFIFQKLAANNPCLISKCEAIGRLRHCGFDVINYKETDDYLYFVAEKGTSKPKNAPVDKVFIKVAKVGENARDIYCLKLRTMHPYANMLHDFILENCEIDNEGKVIDDFRLTGWGKFLRKTWLDEMPQLFNILKGDLSIVGLRPLSKEFLQLYPEEWRQERNKYKPGFVPPYYVDCPKTFEEIIESEKRYIELKKKHPIKTDVQYFIKAALNFIRGKARTG
ncbi:MAG: hypothetical protein A2Y62_16620 [Candidatus Fischerbacteria bacterium RBG_13_37_8]|uniref:Bacterial sugar transferase domain-containing protein n=1 Tax=Candidatus Fischerbacteria bacterium RBG_13_37_8 TaxID=1817863 RepID=A0A1F5VNR7_9BACT|nr:MAG: hypothetical protein A2Y62_16620 [Candidatus Fischerbacteria bacterium RBG_13_37_8]